MSFLAYFARWATLLRSPAPARVQDAAREAAEPARILEPPRRAESPRTPESA